MARLLVLLLPFVSGCVAETVVKQRPRKGPVPEVGFVETGGGEVRYATEGWGFVVAARRRSAQRLMRRACKGLVPRVVDEFEREDADISYGTKEDLATNLTSGVDHFQMATYVHLVFECVPPEAPAAKPEAAR